MPRLSTYRRLLAYVWPYRWRVAGALGLSLVAAAAAAAYAYAMGPLLTGVLQGAPVQVGPWALSGTDLSWKLPLSLLVVAAVKASAQWLQGGWMQAVGQRVVADLRRQIYERLLWLPPRFFETRHSGELLSRFTADVAQVEFAVTQALASYLKDSVQLCALLGVCAAIDLRLFALAFVVLPAAALPVARFARAVKKVATRTQASLGKLTELSAESLHNLPIVLAYRGEERSLARFDEEQARYLLAMRRSLFLRGAFTPTLELLGIVGVALAIWGGASAVAAEPQLAQKLLSFLAAALLMYQPLKALSGTFAQAAQGVGAAERLFEIADEPPLSDEGEAAGPLARALELDAVRVSYDGTREALAGLTLTVPAGKRVALVGASGAGKSTVVSALLGFVAPVRGEIRWDGVPLRCFSRSSLRAQMAWVPQEPVLFFGSVRQNLLLARPEAGEPELWEALRRAYAADFVRAFPQGLEENVGERGARLSGGQRQRLAIARAFLRRPSLLLLDEPTSALDAASEQEVQAGLAELMEGRTVLVIAHRLATVRAADVICVLEGGAWVEQGSHDELVARNGRYAALLEAGLSRAAG
ncbi:MAG: ABC transporter ATP-binding protein [Myxococcota bacterium]